MSAPEAMRELADRRAAARAARDFVEADRLRDALAAAGWSVIDGPEGWTLEPAAASAPEEVRVAARDVVDVLDEPPTHDVSVHWVCEGWPEDIDRAIDAFRRLAVRSLQFVVADVTGEPPDRWGEDVEVVPLEAGHGLGGGAQRRAPPVARSHRPRDGRLGRADRRRARSARGRARRPRASGSPGRSGS